MNDFPKQFRLLTVASVEAQGFNHNGRRIDRVMRVQISATTKTPPSRSCVIPSPSSGVDIPPIPSSPHDSNPNTHAVHYGLVHSLYSTLVMTTKSSGPWRSDERAGASGSTDFRPAIDYFPTVRQSQVRRRARRIPQGIGRSYVCVYACAYKCDSSFCYSSSLLVH